MGARINLLQIPTGDLEEIRKYLISQKLELERWNNIISFHTHRGTLNDFDAITAYYTNLPNGSSANSVLITGAAPFVWKELTSANTGTKFLRDDGTWQTALPALPALTTNHLWAGVANVATDCDVAGDVTLSASGTTITTAIASGVIVNADIKSDAAIATTKLGAGAVIQMVATLNTSYTTTGTTTMPLDNTIPQGNEGVAFSNSASFTPKASTSQLRIDVIMNVMCASQHHMTMGLFTATGAVNAIASCTMLTPVAGNMFIMSLTHYMNATDTSARTFYVRVGSHAGGTVRLNSLDGNQWLGGTLQSSIVVSEISQ